MSSSNIVFLHGIEGHAGIHWQRWLAERLAERGHTSYLLDFPNATQPDRLEWLDYFSIYGGRHDPADLVLVGHSLGVVTALDYVQRAPGRVKALVSVSGFGNDYGSDLNGRFLSSANIDFAAVRDHLGSAAVFFGDDDPFVPQDELRSLANNLNVAPHVISNGGHLNVDSGYQEFAELLEVVASLAA